MLAFVLIPLVTPPLKYTGMRLTYVEADLEPAARAAHDVIKNGPQGVRGVVDLACEYIEGLREIVREADRQGLFEQRDAGASPVLGRPLQE